MLRTRLYDIRMSGLPETVGLCVGDVQGIARYTNRSQERLLYAKEAGDDGWNGTWAEIAFQVSCPPTTAAPTLPGPYWTAPRGVARLEAVDLCDMPIRVNNQFVEYLEFGNGRMPKRFFSCHPNSVRQVYTRNNVPTFVDLSNPPQILQVVFTNPADAGKRMLLQGLDNNNNVIYTQDGLNQVNGVFVVAPNPGIASFVNPPMRFNQIYGVQKDITLGPVNLFQVDPTTGNQILLLTMEPTEQTASYRRYFFNNLPASCCFPLNAQVPQNLPVALTVTGIVKMDLIPVFVDTDYLLLTCKEAIVAEAASIRYGEVDNQAANIQMSRARHQDAIRLLNGELTHFQGMDDPAVEWAPFGAARLEKQRIGTML